MINIKQKFYVIKNEESFYHFEFGKNSTWVKDISEATIYDNKNTDQQNIPTYVYAIENLHRFEGFPLAKLCEVEQFYKEK